MNRLRIARDLVPEDGIGLYLIERLGNQLFMYAAALEQARRLDCSLHLNLAYYRRRPKPDRPYSLDAFDHGMVVNDDPRRDPLLYRGYPGLRVARPWYQFVRPVLAGGHGKVFVERSFAYDDAIHRIERGTTLLGYFQSWRNFPSVGDELRSRITALTAPSPWYLETAKAVADEKGAVVLNVRRGDYRDPDLQRVHGLATRSYYERALRMLRAQGFGGPALVVSDEIDIALEELDGIDAQLEPLEAPPGTHPLEIMLTMSGADAMVMGNSSFSWWAAWLGHREDRPVIGPRPWFADPALNERDLLLPGWLTLASRDD
jgi:hypothetical protein